MGIGGERESTHRVLEGLKEELVSKHVNGKLLISERVDAGGSSARGSSDLKHHVSCEQQEIESNSMSIIRPIKRI